MFIKENGQDIHLAKINVDNIIFDSTNKNLCKEFVKNMYSEFEMSMMGEWTFFHGLQIKQTREVTFIHKEKYTKKFINKFPKPSQLQW